MLTATLDRFDEGWGFNGVSNIGLEVSQPTCRAEVKADVLPTPLLVYPRLARRILREKLATLIRGLDLFYNDIRGFIYLPESQVSVAAPLLLKAQLSLSGQLVELETLLLFASAEPRLAGPFQSGVYRSIIGGLHGLLGSLSAARWALGNDPVAPTITRFMAKPGLVAANRQMTSTARLLFYVYGASLQSRLPLPRDLPSAVEMRRKLYLAFFALARKAPQDLQAMIKTESWIRFYSYVLAIRGVASELESLGPHFKQLLGVLSAPPLILDQEGYENELHERVAADPEFPASPEEEVYLPPVSPDFNVENPVDSHVEIPVDAPVDATVETLVETPAVSLAGDAEMGEVKEPSISADDSPESTRNGTPRGESWQSLPTDTPVEEISVSPQESVP
ncbi:hypothetical protein BDK51DRAFT_48985 [Blyttiomyces helicus]|uniref:DUF2421 domain-containing protein n=1 Tax=Blyttiomyces helicus TaxID=388810 RepID=A0A4P9WBV6_9FUNG|nr:hypothetical protein BDK51DRAFT_48985 [Blyttiomyces helicus]|eukprot:RKO90111.1 hypothetical protein BDK51DRAFT_48985 [Blyttiomyces helicus]